MPHLILEVSKNLEGNIDINALQKSLHQNLMTFPTIDASSIKTRVTSCEFWSVGIEGDPDAFMHLTLALLPGRPAELKSEMSTALSDVLKNSSKNVHVGCACSVSVEELDAETYRSSSVSR